LSADVAQLAMGALDVGATDCAVGAAMLTDAGADGDGPVGVDDDAAHPPASKATIPAATTARATLPMPRSSPIGPGIPQDVRRVAPVSLSDDDRHP
jgi:hypothetical protein